MNILTLNIGSTSFKYALFDKSSLKEVIRGSFDVQPNGDAGDEIKRLFRQMLREIGDIDKIDAIGHRIVHGGTKYGKTIEIEAGDVDNLKEMSSLAPLHNPYNLAGVIAAGEYIPQTPNFAVFDTAFFNDLPESSQMFPIPSIFYHQKDIKRYGFHGISHYSAALQAAAKLKKDLEKLNLITIHLGGGSSMTAIKKGKVIDTTMGFTPLDGLVMMTRPGSLDPGLVIELVKMQEGELQEKIAKVENILNKKSGIVGISGYSDYLELLEGIKKKDPGAKLAFDMYTNSIKKHLGAFVAMLNNVDAVVFTGKIGSGDPVTRKTVCDKMNMLNSSKILTIDTNEELAIATQVKNTLT